MPDAYDTHRPIHCHKIRPIALNAARFATMFLHVALVDARSGLGFADGADDQQLHHRPDL